MKNKMIYILSIINALAVTAVIAFKMNSPVAVHFGPSGAADRYGSKWEYLLFALLPVVMAVVCDVLQRKNIGNRANKKYENKIVPLIILLFAGLGWIFISIVLKGVTDKANSALNLIMVPIGLLIIYISNLLPKLEPNRTFGIRIAPTLADEKVWRKTHRFGAYTGVIGGIIIVAGALVGYIYNNYVVTFSCFGAGILLLAVVPVIYAYSIYKK